MKMSQVRNRMVAVACALGLLVVAVVLIAAAAPKPVYYDVKAVAATYPSGSNNVCNPPPSTSRVPVRMVVSAVDPTTGLTPTGPVKWTVAFEDTMAGIPDSQFSGTPDRNCFCEVPDIPFTVTGVTLFGFSMPLRYTGNGTCGGGPTDVNNCFMPVGDYRFVAQATNVSSNTGGTTVGVLQVRDGSCVGSGGISF